MLGRPVQEKTMQTFAFFVAATMPLWSSPAFAQDGVERAATQPLRDTRIKDEKIPPILQLAASAPYSTTDTQSCSQSGRRSPN
jgi:hypothetical protein